MKKVNNYVTVEGKLFGMGRRPLKRLDDGRIAGSIAIQTTRPDESNEHNTVELNFMPQGPTYKSGKKNRTYEALQSILESGKTVEAVGYSDASAFNITGDISGNAFYTQQGELVETYEIRGGFINSRNGGSLRPHTGFRVDTLITSIEDKIDKEGNVLGKTIRGQVYDDYRKFFFPVTFTVEDEDAIDFIVANYIPGETYTTLDGEVINKVIEEEGTPTGFGESSIPTTRTVKELLITGGGVSGTLPMSDEKFEEARQNRETYLAEQKARTQEKKGSSKKSKPQPKASATISAGGKYEF